MQDCGTEYEDIQEASDKSDSEERDGEYEKQG